MVLPMSRPQLHPRSGVYWLRKRVPADLVTIVGRREEYFSLQTRDPAEAKRRHAEELLKLEQRWAGLRAGPRSLAEVEAHELSRVVHDQWLDQHRSNPSEQTFWSVTLGKQLWASLQIDPATLLSENWLSSFDADGMRIRQLEDWCRQCADQILTTHGLIVDEVGRLRLAKAVSAAMQRASLALAQQADGNYAGLPAPVPFEQQPVPATISARKSVTFDDLVKGWAAEKQPAAKTLYEWTRVVGQFSAFLGRTDAASVTPEDVIAWKETMIRQGLRPKTIRDGRLAPVRAILQWGVDSRRLKENPAARVSMDVKAKPSEKIRSFTDQEAALVLRAALAESDPVLRWVPWLCAYSGARVSEVCQLRVQDVLQVEGIWCMRFDPDAGPLKTAGSERAVPLHQAVLDGGFLSFVQTLRPGPLFPGLPPDKFGKRGGNGTKVLGRWVRGLGLTDERLAPNHSWRHRFKTLGRRLGLATDLVNAITGHGKRTVADSYGEFEMVALHRELMKIPALALEG